MKTVPYLQNGHHTPGLISSLETFVLEQPFIDPQFRLWVSAENNGSVPIRLLQNSIKIQVRTYAETYSLN